MDVLNDVKANIGVLPEQTRQLYETGTFHQLKDWMSVKLGKLMSASVIGDKEIR